MTMLPAGCREKPCRPGTGGGAIVLAAVFLASCGAEPQPGAGPAIHDADIPSITHGMAEMTDQYLFVCDVPGWRVTAQGEITASDGTRWVVPAEVAFKTGPKASDLYNDCAGFMPDSAEALDLDTVPVAEIDAAGEVITAYIFGDNYYEIYVNGALVAVDAVPYWPFNPGVVRFRVQRPFTVAFKLVDWEENLGIGSEMMRGLPFHLGDGGLAAIFRDAAGQALAVTDGAWRAQTYYVGPLLDPECLSVTGETRLSGACEIASEADGANVFSAHWSIPENWAAPDFDDSRWQAATVYSNEAIGRSLNRPAYENFADIFDAPDADAEFIWSSNLLLDNLVLVRRVID